MNTCRLCHGWSQPLFKVGVRHWVHATCALTKWGVKFLDRLQPHQIAQLPFIPLQDAGLLDEAKRRAAPAIAEMPKQ